MSKFKQYGFTMALLTFSMTGFAQTASSIAEPLNANIAPAMTDAPFDRATLKYSNKWRVRFENTAKSDGELVFRVTEKGADPVIVRIAIKKGTREGNSCDVVKRKLRKALPRDFKVEGDDGDHVLVKHNFLEDRFSLELIGNDIKKLKVKISKE